MIAGLPWAAEALAEVEGAEKTLSKCSEGGGLQG